MYMKADQKANLSQKISSQKHGIVLIWSAYDEADLAVKDYDFNFTFIPKAFFNLNLTGNGVDVLLNRTDMNAMGTKYIYVSNNSITGYKTNADNKKTVNGFVLYNKYWVLRYVIGI